MHNRVIFLVIFLLVFSLNSFSATITVTNSNDSGTGSLRDAIGIAATGDNIVFDGSLANTVILLASQLEITQQLRIDGTTQNISISGGGVVRCLNITGSGLVEIFNLNIIDGQGGAGAGIAVNTAALDVRNCLIKNCNTGGDGGGIYANGGANISVQNSIIQGCSGGDGGGIKVFGGNHDFKNVHFNGNNTTGFGGGFHALFAGATFENVAFTGNRANYGGAAYFRGATTLINCTVAGNRANTNGGAFHIYGNMNIDLINSIVWNNSASGSTSSFGAFYSIENGSSVNMYVTASTLEHSGGSVAWTIAYGTDNGGNLDADPIFNSMLSPTIAPTTNGIYELTTSSPCFNSGLNAQTTIGSDLLQNTRIIYGTVDMGAYEFCETTGSSSVTECTSYTVPSGDETYTVSGVYKDTLSNYLGCDSILTIALTINDSYGSQSVTACDSYVSPSGVFTWTTSGTYNDTIPNANSCDSIITTTLTINNSTSGTDTQTACDSYLWIDGMTYTSNNNSATHTLTNAVGCDSVVTLDLTILNSTTGIDMQSACDTYLWIDGMTYTSSNNSATHTLTNANGCDSVVTLNLTILNSTVGTDIQVACDSYVWIDGMTYTSSNNSATHTLTNAAGCDSVVTLNLTINNSNTGTDVQTACDSYVWIDGMTYTSSNNSATHTLTNTIGCDSIVTLDLTINNSNTGVDVKFACDSYTWIDGMTYTAHNSTATHTLTNIHGCDSVVTLSLTMTTESQHSFSETVCDSYISPSGLTWINSGIYNDTIPNFAGCDSVITIDLTVHTKTYSNINEIVCFEYISPSGILYTETGIYEDIIPNFSGCDSIITIDLTIKSVDVDIETEDAQLISYAEIASFQWLSCDDTTLLLENSNASIYKPTKLGEYRVEVTQNECVDTSYCVYVDLLESNPTAFSPNNDGVNDIFILNIESAENIVTIYNRWGDKVIEFINYNDNDIVWDGNDEQGNPQIGTFFYVVESDSGNESGWIEVLR